MKQEKRRAAGIVLAALAFAANYSPWMREAMRLPDTLVLSSGQTHVVRTGLPMRVQALGGAVQVAASSDERLGEAGVSVSAAHDGEARVTFSLLGLIPVHETKVSVVGERMLIPGGQAVGVAMKTQGVLVVAQPGKDKGGLRVGDVIVSVGGEEIASAAELSRRVNALSSDSVTLGVLRGGKEMTVEASVPAEADGSRRLGIWVRDSTAGVGTLSYIDPDSGAYGALGHAIVDADTGGVLAVQDGAIMRAQIVGVSRGEAGRAGELKGNFLKDNDQIGTLARNGVYGIYGQLEEEMDDLLYPEGLPVGSRSAVHTGAASIIATVDAGGPREYAIEITRCFEQSEPSQKGMILRVTDPDLLAKTGGIVQGMSGSPILQDGRIIGAVTHVYLNDATQGYGMYIEWMLRQSDSLSEGEAA